MARRAGCQTGGRSKGRRLGRKQSPDAYRYCCRWGSRATCSFAGTNARPASDGTPRIHRPWVRVFWSTTAEETVCRTFHLANTEQELTDAEMQELTDADIAWQLQMQETVLDNQSTNQLLLNDDACAWELNNTLNLSKEKTLKCKYCNRPCRVEWQHCPSCDFVLGAKEEDVLSDSD